jgi:hypothetical protein
MTEAKVTRYRTLLERVFFNNYEAGAVEVPLTRVEFVAAADELGIKSVLNLGDIVYTFRHGRDDLPESLVAKAPAGREWAIFPDGRSKYRLVAVPFATVRPTPGMSVTKIPDATPGLIEMYALSDEQALLAKVRYNRLLDIYTGITTYSLQSHLRTSIEIEGDKSQVETDEVYVGVDGKGAHYVFPVQAKGGKKDVIGVVQIWQDFKLCQTKFPDLVPRPVAAQFMADDVIALFAFDWDGAYGITIAPASERHYRLVDPADLTPDELRAYASAVP